MAKRPGLYANIQAKRERIEAGSGERMRKPGTKGAVAIAAEHLPAASDLFGNLAPTAQLVEVVVAAGFIAYLLWKRTR